MKENEGKKTHTGEPNRRERKKLGRNELIMSHFYTGSSDYTNGGNVQKIFCMAYGTSAAICASFHKNWQWRSWWSVVTAKNTARPETEGEREGDGGGREGGSNASIALLAGLDSSLHSFWCSNYKEKKERERKRNEDQRGEERGNKEKLRPCLRRSTCDCFFFFFFLGQVWTIPPGVTSPRCLRMSPTGPL